MEAYAHLKTPAQLKDEGNAAFRVGKYETAVGKYNAALVKLRKADADGLSGTLHCNAAVCLVKLGRCEEAVKAATAAADHATSNDGTRAKALVYRARAYQGSRHRPPEAAAALARVDLEAACKLQPASGPIKVELQRLVEGGAQGAASQAPQAIVKAAATAHDDADLPKALLDDAAMRGRLASTRLYGADEVARRSAPAPVAPAEDEPPREWVLQRMQEALDRKKLAEASTAIEDDEDLAKGYVQRDDGTETPAWSAPRAAAVEPPAAPRAPMRIPDGAAAPKNGGFNRGYREVDTSVWCRRRLLACLKPLTVHYLDEDVRDGAAGVVRLTPISASGEALLVRVGERWDRAYDLQARFDFEARLGAPRTKDVEMKGKMQRIFMGVPTVRGAIVVRELTHIDGPSEAVIELQWGYGSVSEAHFERDEVGMRRVHADALRKLLRKGKEGGDAAEMNVHGAVVEMLARFVADFQREVPGEPRPRLGDVSDADHFAQTRVAPNVDAVLAADAAEMARQGVTALMPTTPPPKPWTWRPADTPKTELEIAPGSKLAQMHGVSAPADAARDAAAAEAAQVAYAGPAHEGDARGGFGHTMMEQFEALRKQGYTVLMGEAGDRDAAPAPAPAAAPAAALNYERFENIGDSESDDDGADFGEVEAAPKVSADTTALWEAVLSLAGGDVAAARELLADPDALQRRPEIQALYEDAA